MSRHDWLRWLAVSLPMVPKKEDTRYDYRAAIAQERLRAASSGEHSSGRLVAAAVAYPGRGFERAPGRVLARYRRERLDRGRWRGLGARPLLARWTGPAGLLAGSRTADTNLRSVVPILYDR